MLSFSLAESLTSGYVLFGGLVALAAVAAVWLVVAPRDTVGAGSSAHGDWLEYDGTPADGSQPSSPFL